MKLIVVLFFAVFASFGWLAQSPEEEQFDKWMKTVGATMGKLRKDIDAKAGDEVAKDAATLAGIFKQAEEFWKGRKKDDAVEWSQKAATAAGEIEAAGKAGDFEKAGAGVRTLFANCSACHKIHREQLPEGGYRIKQ
jgi:cytochrome c556